MKNSLLFLSVSLLVASPVFAQDDLVPATSEDIRNFDSQVPQVTPVINPPVVTTTPRESEGPESIEAAHGPDHQSGNGRGRGRGRGGEREDRRENFGAAVSEEAKRLNDSPKEDRPKRDEGISGHRRRDHDRKIPGDASTVASGPGMGSTMGGSSDARASAPKPEDDSRPHGIEDRPEGIEDGAEASPERSDHTSGRNRGGSNRPRRDH